MAVTYYDDAIKLKIKRWFPDNSKLYVLGPDEIDRLYELKASDSKDKPINLPFIALSREKNITLSSTIKQDKSFRGFPLLKPEETAMPDQDLAPNGKILTMNVIPIELKYQLDIFCKYQEEADEYMREFVFKLINNPRIALTIPYNGFRYNTSAFIRLNDTINDNSDSQLRLFKGQFYRWTIQFEIQDAFLFSAPYVANWAIQYVDIDEKSDNKSNYDSLPLNKLSKSDLESLVYANNK